MDMILTVSVLAAVLVFAAAGRMLVIKKTKEKPIRCLKERVEISQVKNTGLSFSMMKKRPALVKLVHLLAMLVSAAVLFRPVQKGNVLFRIGAGFFLGGGLSNLLERLFFGYVIDYVRFLKAKMKKLRRIVFNLADFCIVIGAVLMLASLWKKSS